MRPIEISVPFLKSMARSFESKTCRILPATNRLCDLPRNLCGRKTSTARVVKLNKPENASSFPFLFIETESATHIDDLEHFRIDGLELQGCRVDVVYILEQFRIQERLAGESVDHIIINKGVSLLL